MMAIFTLDGNKHDVGVFFLLCFVHEVQHRLKLIAFQSPVSCSLNNVKVVVGTSFVLSNWHGLAMHIFDSRVEEIVILFQMTLGNKAQSKLVRLSGA